ncbi:metallophosphoesterase [Paenibacillus glycanilyticus]|uniref:metallophosphoesterase n=1 Tax=Paenibacillus glycanilyticus TaxID=126569 RepID=UPI002040A7B0|nr:metallophosphoesterase [Paenibacillus glycanilyticus]MCM3629268.1 metallophosphoesterase [Paenibacillus glycanilyticus]
MRARFIPVITVFLLLFSLVNGYIGWNGWVYLSTLFDLKHALPYGIIVGILSFSWIIGRLGQHSASPFRQIAYFLKHIGSYWFGVMQYGLMILPLADLIVWLLTLASVEYKTAVASVGTITFVLLASILIRGAWNAWTPIVRKYQLTIPKHAGTFDKLRIGVASDIHLGTVVGNKHLERLVRHMEEMKPDLILLPGDVIDDSIDPFIRRNMAATMSKLKAPLGIYAVLGNHEYIGGHIDQYIAQMNAIGIRVLLDENVLIQDSFYIIGRKDLAARHSDPEGRLPISELAAHVDKALPLIMMDHQPSDLEQASLNGIDLSLSGHTHRGQMAPNHLITRRIFELDWGYKLKGSLHAIVSSGFGSWGPPLRLGSRSEIIQVELAFKPGQ